MPRSYKRPFVSPCGAESGARRTGSTQKRSWGQRPCPEGAPGTQGPAGLSEGPQGGAQDPEFKTGSPSVPSSAVARADGGRRPFLPEPLHAPGATHPQRPHLVNLSEGAVAQLAHDLPHLVGVHVPADVLIFAGLSLLEGRQAQDAAEIGKSHGWGRASRGARWRRLRL